MDLSSASDDQIALMGCAVALLVSGGLMYLSYFIGRAGRQESEPDTLSLESHLQPRTQDESDRKAA